MAFCSKPTTRVPTRENRAEKKKRAGPKRNRSGSQKEQPYSTLQVRAPSPPAHSGIHPDLLLVLSPARAAWLLAASDLGGRPRSRVFVFLYSRNDVIEGPPKARTPQLFDLSSPPREAAQCTRGLGKTDEGTVKAEILVLGNPPSLLADHNRAPRVVGFRASNS